MGAETDHPGVRALFDALADLPAGARAGHLAEARRHDPETAARAERLLAAMEGAGEPEPVIVFDEEACGDGLGVAGEVWDNGGMPGKGACVGTPMGAVEIVRLLSDPARAGGGAGSAVVYEGRHADAGRVALKLLRDTGTGHEVRRRFLAEAEALRSLDHPHIARLLCAGPIERGDGRVCMGILTRFVPGPTLDVWAASGEEDREAGEIVRVVAQVARAVEHIHLRQILHRDIKPSNIIVEPGHGRDGHGVLLDMGVAKFLGGRADQFASLGHTVAGTLRYMAPEQLTPSSVRVDYRADLYALGVVLYELLTGRPPVDLAGQSEVEAYRLKMEARPRVPAEMGGLGVRALALQAAIVAAAARPEDRYTSADRFADDLDRAVEGRPLSIRPMGRARRLVLLARRRPAAAVAVTLGTAGLLAWAGTYIASQQHIDAARARAEARFDDTRSFARWAIFELTDQLGTVSNTTTVRHRLIEQAAQTLERLAQDPVAGPDLLLELAEGYERLGELLDVELGDIAGSAAYFAAADRLLRRMPERDAPELRMMQAWLDFRGIMTRDLDHYPADHVGQIAALIRSLDRLEPALAGDVRLYWWRSKMLWQYSQQLVTHGHAAEEVLAVAERSVADADRAVALSPHDSQVQSSEVMARFWRAYAFNDVDDPRALEVTDEAIASARRFTRTGHSLADFHLARALGLRCSVLARSGDLERFVTEAVVAIEASDLAAAREPDNRWMIRHAEVTRILLADAVLHSPRRAEAELLTQLLKWANEGWVMWQARSARGWTIALEEKNYPERYMHLIRQIEDALAE